MALCMVAFAVSGCCKDKDEDEPRKNNHSQVEGDSIPSQVDVDSIPDNTFVVNVADNDADGGVGASAVNSFWLVGVQGSESPWIDNFLFTKSADKWAAVGHEELIWPDGAGKHTFYATCDNTGDSIAVSADGRFVYTVPADISSQKDLLVSMVKDHDGGTPVTLGFRHALSSAKFKIGFDNTARGGENDLRIHVTRITLYHIATKGSFDFAGFDTNPWSVDAQDADYADIVIDLKKPVDFTPSAVADFIVLGDDYIDADIYVMPHKPTPWDTDGTAGHPLNNSYIGVTCQIVEYRTNDTPTYYDLCGLDEDSDEDDYEEAKEMYIDLYEGLASTDNDDWLNDKVVSMIVPTNQEWGMNVVLESILNHRNSQAAANGTSDNVEEVYIPLTMTDGFGFGSTDTIDVRMDRMKYSNGRDFFAPFVPVIIPK